MRSGDRNIITDSYIASSISSNLQCLFIFSIKNKKHFWFCIFFFLNSRTQSFQNYKIIFWFFNLNYIHYFVVNIHRKRKFLFAEFTVNFFIFENHMAFDSFHSFISFKPFSKTLEVDSSHCPWAVARRNHWIIIIIILI